MQEQLILPAILTPDRRQKRLVRIVALLVPVPFIAIIPFGQVQLPQVDSYIPVVDTVMLINESIAATLLLAQFSITRSPSMLALAGGFLLTAFLVIPHALTFPGAFAPDGLLGAGLQTTPWLNEFWFLGLPSAVIAYVQLKSARPISRGAIRLAVLTTATVVFALTCALLWLTTHGAELLPPIMSDPVHPQLSWHFLPLIVSSLIAMALLWSRRQSSLDLWLLVVLEAWMLNALMFNKFVVRFSLFWYCGRAFSALTVSAILCFLLSETTKVYWRLARSHAMLERERHNRLMSLEAAAASISHEMKQPLTAITANAAAAMHLLALVPPDLDEARAALSDLIDDGHRASQVLDNLRVLFGKADREQASVDLSEAALRALRALRGELADHGIAVSADLASELPPVAGHRGQLQEVITNLLYNAMEAMTAVQADRRMLKVRTKLDGGNAIVVEVQDSGPGIDRDHLDRIFDAFVTTKPHGTGLGLAICRMIVERHGGQLSAVSDGKNGALFQIVLPSAPGSRTTPLASIPLT
jgi:signal transduction histidine kinase